MKQFCLGQNFLASVANIFVLFSVGFVFVVLKSHIGSEIKEVNTARLEAFAESYDSAVECISRASLM